MENKENERIVSFIHESSFSLKSKYINNKTNVVIECDKGHIFEKKPDNIRGIIYCPICKEIDFRKRNVTKILKILREKKYKLVTSMKEVFDTREVKYKCEKCGHISTRTIRRFLDGTNGCDNCTDWKKRLLKTIKEERYTLLSDKRKIKATSDRIMLQCPEGHQAYEVDINHFLNRNQRCPYCKSSYGEQICTELLEVNNLDYIKEKTFNDLIGVNGGLLRFDFYIKKYNIAIEIDGLQHFDNNKLYYSESVIKHDKIKSDYCFKNNIYLLRITYDDKKSKIEFNENLKKKIEETLFIIKNKKEEVGFNINKGLLNKRISFNDWEKQNETKQMIGDYTV